MPDQNNPTDANLNPPQVTPPGEPGQLPTLPVSDVPPPAPMDIPPADASLPPPFPPDAGSAAPNFDIPPVITPGQPNKKFGGKRVIATILGLLVLVGGLGAGVILVQQQQDIREKAAAGNLCKAEEGSCVPDNYTCSEGSAKMDCPSGKKCGFGTCKAPAAPTSTQQPTTLCSKDCVTSTSQCVSGSQVGGVGYGDCGAGEYCCTQIAQPTCRQECLDQGNTPSECNALPPCPGSTAAPTSSPGSGGGQCTRVSSTERVSGDSLTVTPDDFEKCQTACSDGTLWVAKYTCDGINLSQGCQDNGVILDNLITTQEAVDRKSFPVGNLTCGTVQIDVGCKNASNTWGNVKFLSKSASTACSTSTPPPGDGPTAQCLNIKAFDANWTELTSAQLAQIKVGDTVRFTVAGQASSGSFDKARFKINSVQRPEVTGKRPGTDEYYDEYTIPAGITTFTINAQIHHATLGWSN